VIVADLDLEGVTVDEAKAHPPLVVDRDGMLPVAIIPQDVQPIARRDLQVVERRGQIHVLKLAHGAREHVGGKALRGPGKEQVSRAPIRERLDHEKA
jgi:hypothetical protein